MSKYVSEMKLGDKIDVRGPKGQFLYKPNQCREIGMIAGGTGVTPMLQVARAILSNPADKTKVSLIFANVNAEDILLKDMLAEMTKNPQFKVYYVLNNVLIQSDPFFIRLW
jgi:cytochrome-b5 reductase